MSQSPDNDEKQGDPKLRVLVVDDEPTLRLGFAYALSNRTTTVETAASGRHALERIAEVDFDIMILDLRMPELDGLGVIEALRGQGNAISVVLCSAALSPNAALRAIRLGVVDFLPKPVRPADLRQVIEFVLRPGRKSFPLAMQAARNQRPGEAIRILSGDPTLSRHAACWLDVFKAIQHAGASGDVSPQDWSEGELEEKIRCNLPMLSFTLEPDAMNQIDNPIQPRNL